MLSVSISPCPVMATPFSLPAGLYPGPQPLWGQLKDPWRGRATTSPTGGARVVVGKVLPSRHTLSVPSVPMVSVCLVFFQAEGGVGSGHMQCWLYGHVQEGGLRTRWGAGQGQEGDPTPAMSGARTPQPESCSHPTG